MTSPACSCCCSPHYAKAARHTSGKLKAVIYREYGITKAQRKRGHYEIDHLVPLGLGGADVAPNLWRQSRDAEPWSAKRKDRLEAIFIPQCVLVTYQSSGRKVRSPRIG